MLRIDRRRKLLRCNDFNSVVCAIKDRLQHPLKVFLAEKSLHWRVPGIFSKHAQRNNASKWNEKKFSPLTLWAVLLCRSTTRYEPCAVSKHFSEVEIKIIVNTNRKRGAFALIHSKKGEVWRRSMLEKLKCNCSNLWASVWRCKLRCKREPLSLCWADQSESFMCDIKFPELKRKTFANNVLLITKTFYWNGSVGFVSAIFICKRNYMKNGFALIFESLVTRVAVSLEWKTLWNAALIREKRFPRNRRTECWAQKCSEDAFAIN